jgi:hypothetical protein
MLTNFRLNNRDLSAMVLMALFKALWLRMFYIEVYAWWVACCLAISSLRSKMGMYRRTQ